MMWLGVILIWIALIWCFQSYFKKFLALVHKRDEQRMYSLQNRLHLNFVFREKGNIQRWSRWFAILGSVISLFFHSVVSLLVVFILYIFFPMFWIRWIEHKRAVNFQKQLLLLIPSITSMLRAGHGIEKSLLEIRRSLNSPMKDEIMLILNEMQLGKPLEETLQSLMRRFPSENLNMFVHAVVISRKLGTSLAEAMDNISQNILEKEKLKSQIHALTSQGKMQAYIASAMPFLMIIVLQFISPGYFDSLFTSFVGRIGIGYSILSLILGQFWIYKITHKEYL